MMHPGILLDRTAERPLHEQLAGQLRRLILRGELPPGTRLAPSRAAARELRVSRNVVVLAYESLGLEGYLESRVGSGTRVRDSLPAHLLTPKGIPAPAGPKSPPPSVRLSRQGERLAASRGIPVRRGGAPGAFLPGVASPEHFPARVWSRLAGRIWRSRASEVAPYGDARGFAPLREAISDHVRRSRAVRCSPEQIIVTSGSQQALDLIARMLLDAGDAVAVEVPGYRGARMAFAAAGARLVPAPVDREGLDFPGAGEPPADVRLVYATPSHQYPLGVTLTLSRRLRLLEWAQRSGAWIIEDDYDSEFRYESRPLPSLQGLDPVGRVIYLGTFSKVLAAGIRLGFMVLPEPLVEPFRAARSALDTHSPLILQATLAEFIRLGHFERHVARMRGVYAERRSVLRSAIASTLGERVETVDGNAGLHLTTLLPAGVDDRLVSTLAAERGVEAPALSDYSLAERGPPGLVLGFGAAPPERIAPGVEVLAGALDRAGARAGSGGRPAQLLAAGKEIR